MDTLKDALLWLGFNAAQLPPWQVLSVWLALALAAGCTTYGVVLAALAGQRLLVDCRTALRRRRRAEALAAQETARTLAEARTKRARSEAEAVIAEAHLHQQRDDVRQEKRRHQTEVAALQARIAELEKAVAARDRDLAAAKAAIEDRDGKLVLAERRNRELLLENDEITRSEQRAVLAAQDAVRLLEEGRRSQGVLQAALEDRGALVAVLEDLRALRSDLALQSA